MNQKQLLQMQKKMMEAYVFLKEKTDYYRNATIEQVLNDLEKQGISLTEQEIIEKYKELYDSGKTNDYFYYRDKILWQRIDSKKGIVNSDALYFLIDEIVNKYLDIKTLPDPHYIMSRMSQIDEIPKNKVQDEILNLIELMVEAGKRQGVYSIDKLIEDYDTNAYLKDVIRKCHNRDSHFKEIIKSYYETFEDADKNIIKL